MTSAALPKLPDNMDLQHAKNQSAKEQQLEKTAALRIVSRSTFADVTDLLLQGVQEEVFPGAVLVIGKNGQEIYRQAAGYRSCSVALDQAALVATPEMVYDIGTITQQLVTTTLLMRLTEGATLKVEDRLVRHLQSFSVQGKSDVTVAHLLSHCSGLTANYPFYEELVKQQASTRLGIIASRGARDYIYHALVRHSLKSKPGTRELFSDLGFMVLGNLLETLTGLSLSRLAQKHVFNPLGLKSTCYIDLAMLKQKGMQPVTDLIAPTEECQWRGRVLCGEVHDDNAWVMGGVAGHAGIFSNATDLHNFAQQLLLAYHGQSAYLKASTVKTFWQTAPFVEDASCTLGWQHPTVENNIAGCGLSDAAVGHNSTTGCSLWIDPVQNLSVVLLSNRINPTRANKKIKEFRTHIFSKIQRAVQ